MRRDGPRVSSLARCDVALVAPDNTAGLCARKPALLVPSLSVDSMLNVSKHLRVSALCQTAVPPGTAPALAKPNAHLSKGLFS